MPTYDNASSQVDSQASILHFASGSDLSAVAVFMLLDTTDNNVVASPTYDGASMTQLVRSSREYLTDRWQVLEIWGLAGVPSGSKAFEFEFDSQAVGSFTALLTYSGAGAGFGSVNASSANSGDPEAEMTAQNYGTTLLAGGMVKGGDTDPFSGSGISLLIEGATGPNTGLDFGYFIGERTATSGPDTIGAQGNVQDRWSMVAAEIK